MKRALVVGVIGQDGAHLTRLPLGKGYRVFNLRPPELSPLSGPAPVEPELVDSLRLQMQKLGEIGDFFEQRLRIPSGRIRRWITQASLVHSIDLGSGIVMNGHRSPGLLEAEFERPKLTAQELPGKESSRYRLQRWVHVAQV